MVSAESQMACFSCLAYYDKDAGCRRHHSPLNFREGGASWTGLSSPALVCQAFCFEILSNLDWSRTGGEQTELEKELEEERRRRASLSPKDKLAEWTAKHQLSVIVGSWALTMGLIGSKVMRDPLISTPNKIVQVRLWAQGLTIGVIIATAALTHSQRAQAANMRKHSPDHTWVYLLDEQRLEKERAQKA